MSSIFIGSWSHRPLLPSMYPNSRFPEGKQGFSIGHVVCTNIINTLQTLLAVSVLGNPPEIQVSNGRQGLTLKAGLSDCSPGSLD